jgi:mevalonate kinase
MLYKASAPGSLMLLGEYAVLYGKHALVCAVDKRITVTLTPRSDSRVEIQSLILGSTPTHYVTELSQLTIEKPFHFVMGALKHYQSRLKYGCNIDIVSEFSDQVGLGSSAAVTVATLATIVTWLGIKTSPLDLIRQSRHVVRAIQGVGSGADLAASVYGGIVGYQAQPLAAEKFAAIHPLTVLYAGFKTPTVEAIKRVQQYFSDHPNLLRSITNSIGQCAAEGMQFVRKEEWHKLGEVMNIQQGLMESLGVSTGLMHEMVSVLRQHPDMLGAKISGAGLGDCVIGLGKMSGEHSMQHIQLSMTLQGVHCEKI